jgi:hypothetical protein
MQQAYPHVCHCRWAFVRMYSRACLDGDVAAAHMQDDSDDMDDMDEPQIMEYKRIFHAEIVAADRFPREPPAPAPGA